jgi:predicted nucleic acid-binding protein
MAAAWARLRAHPAETGGRVGPNDLEIAATALAETRPMITPDADFDPLPGVAGLALERV